ncbi:ankyrin repeat domain-containing protein 6 isoform X2 [Pseudomyrmex gracilis]|uniref:ankyrin repeat domain-containing protein 6 isoform X2 n=1 Tax=Pseudomyrmex gracilis TaxID=219809 RepID=UPI000995B97B|nr:ankyrin repeat domain-containing protein 6 isoform X2 [Pseudomyrmex gracilis]XP_020290835.1 ankyrin repeat domain-containing protein 6 isoform X2 [Pseudomyrmex gracilis]
MAEKLREAAACGDVARLTRLLDANVKPLPDENGRGPLLLAAAGGHVEACEALLLRGVDVSATDDHGNSALHEASWRGYSRTVAVLAKALGTQRAPLHARNLAGFAPLHLACQNGHNQSCRELLLAGSNPDLQNNYGDTPLHTSARYGHAGVTRILISALCRVSEQNKNGDTALHIAAAMGRRKLTRILLEAGCDRSLRNKQGETAKDIARRKNHTEILEIISKTRGKSRTRSKSREKDSVDGKIEDDKDHKAVKSNKKREKTGSGTSGGGGSSKKDRKKHKSYSKQHKVRFEKAIMGRQWSPYGCHYYPDPEAFPQPRLDSLPADPLGRGEQYYLDLAGNIRKGPVGVGYTCYCAPFFRHMEAKLERDKAELKAHIDQAHEKLDLKVANLERRTRGQISELTRCVQEERFRCDERYSHVQHRLQRGGRGRYSERPMKTNYNQSEIVLPTRTRSLEDLLDDRPQDRSFEIPGETSIHRGSLDDLDIPAIPRLSISMKDLPSGSAVTRSALRVLDIPPRLNETFDGVIRQSETSPLNMASTESPSVEGRRQQRSCAHDKNIPTEDKTRRNNNALNNGNTLDWSGGRRSVHEIIKRFQQVPDINSGWRRLCGKSKPAAKDEHVKCSQNQRVPSQGNESESSEGEDDDAEQPEAYKGMNYRNGISDDVHYDSIARMPYRSRNPVYSPTPPLHDTHNDSGYSTRMYGSSKGASPSLSGQLECDVILPSSTGPFTNGEQLAALLEQPRGHDLTVYERNGDNVVINIGTASLV